MKIGKRAIPIWFKIFKYDDKDNMNRSHVKEGEVSIKIGSDIAVFLQDSLIKK